MGRLELLFVLFASGVVWFMAFSGPNAYAQAPSQEGDLPGKPDEFVRLPASDGHYTRVTSYVEDTPQAGYHQASEAAREAFRDLKFGVRIHWGVYALWETGESWPFLGMSNERRQQYQELYREFNPKDFHAEDWMAFFKRSGIRVFAFTTKHHDGFSMYDTQTRVKRRVNWTADGGPKIEGCDLAYSIMETPFKRDIVKELCDAARQSGIKIDLYFSHPDWYDADFRPYAMHPVRTPSEPKNPRSKGDDFTAPERTPVETRRMMDRHRAQLKEILSRYGKIDLVCLDQWFGPEVWPELRETMQQLRRIQPDVMFRCRGIGNYGDYYTPEGFVPGAKGNTTMPWMVIHQLGGMWSYQKDASRYKGADWIVRNLVDVVAKGGNFMVGIGPDALGQFHPQAVEALENTGAWLKVNGEAIYGSRPWSVYGEGPSFEKPLPKGELPDTPQDLRFTTQGATLYVIAMAWPDGKLAVKSLGRASALVQGEIQDVRLLGCNDKLEWSRSDAALTIMLPAKKPCEHVFVFNVTGLKTMQ